MTTSPTTPGSTRAPSLDVLGDAIEQAVTELRRVGRPMTADEVWNSLSLPLWPPHHSYSVLGAAVARGLALRIAGHRHDFAIQPMPCMVPISCAGPVCQCTRGASWLVDHSDQPHLHRVVVFVAPFPPPSLDPTTVATNHQEPCS